MVSAVLSFTTGPGLMCGATLIPRAERTARTTLDDGAAIPRAWQKSCFPCSRLLPSFIHRGCGRESARCWSASAWCTCCHDSGCPVSGHRPFSASTACSHCQPHTQVSHLARGLRASPLLTPKQHCTIIQTCWAYKHVGNTGCYSYS